MLKTTDRDLLVISKNALESDDALQEEISVLNQMLPVVEILQNIAHSTEILDINRCRIIKKPGVILKQLQEKSLGYFVFVCNKN
ncbi:MAG: hypothetical protein V4717_17270 [Bacteroidota bacterium]